MPIDVKCLSLGDFSANCYIVTLRETGSTLAVDPGKYSERLVSALESMNITRLDYILLTHGHFDHIGGVSELRKNFGGKVVVHTLDEDCLADGDKSLASVFGLPVNECQADITVNDGDTLPFGKTEIKVIHTPGHTVGGVCYEIEDCLFTGDTLFRLSAGRTDFPGGSARALVDSFRHLKQLEGDRRVFPGHDETTTLSFERKNNPLMKGL